jgi:hypothetical protein
MSQRLPAIMITWPALHLAMFPLHMGIKADEDRLHDIWASAAPTPDSRIVTKTYDPRVPVAGNVEKRMVFFAQLKPWVIDVAFRRGKPVTPQEAHSICVNTAKALGTQR